MIFNLPERAQVIRMHQERGGRIAAVLPVHYPRALFRAFDILPIEVWGPPKVDATRGAAHLQPYVCSVTRNSLSFFLNGGLDFADALVVPHCCDSMQGLASILIDFIRPEQSVVPIYLPRGKGQSDVRFLADEFGAIYARLVEITKRKPTDAGLLESIRREEKADALLAELYRARAAFSQGDFYRLVRSREYLPAEIFLESVGATLRGCPTNDDQEGDHMKGDHMKGDHMKGDHMKGDHMKGDHMKGDHIGSPLRNHIPIILSGIVPEPMSLFDALDQMNALVVGDDFASCGRRLYPAGMSDDPFRRMAESILNAPPDSTRGSAIQDRLDHLLRLVGDSKAKGVVFYDVKFCEPELFYIPTLRMGLQDAGVPSVAIEVDLNEGLTHQILTRLEAFLEMIA